MRILGIEHIGIAVDGIEKEAPFWKLLLDNCEAISEEVKEQKVIPKYSIPEKGK